MSSRLRLVRNLSCVALALLADVAAAEPLIELQAILGASAVLQVDGVRRTVRVGQASPEGVRLVALDGMRFTVVAAPSVR